MKSIQTPAPWVDAPRMERNLERMQQRARALGVALRPHVKTHKCLPIAHRQLALGACGITVSTLAEAEHFHGAGGFEGILYAVAMAPARYERAAQLQARGVRFACPGGRTRRCPVVGRVGGAPRCALRGHDRGRAWPSAMFGQPLIEALALRRVILEPPAQ